MALLLVWLYLTVLIAVHLAPDQSWDIFEGQL